MDLKRSIQGFVGFYNPCCSNMRRWCSVGTMRMGYKLDHLLRQNGNWKKPSTTSTTNSKIPKLPKFMKSPLKKKKTFKKHPLHNKKTKVTCHCASGFFCSSSPARCDSQYPGTSAWRDNLQEGGRHWWWGIRRMFPNSNFLRPKKRKVECFTRENKKNGVDEFRFQESKHKEKKHGCSNE